MRHAGPAFPIFIVAGGANAAEIAKQVLDAGAMGLSVRDYFAAAVLEGILAHQGVLREGETYSDSTEVVTKQDVLEDAQSVAQTVAIYTDAVLKAVASSNG